jgi:hypothetical protein
MYRTRFSSLFSIVWRVNACQESRRDFRLEGCHCGDASQVRTPPLEHLPGLIADTEMVVEDLPLLAGGQARHVDDHSLFTQPRVGVLLQVRASVAIDVVAAGQDQPGALADRGHHQIHPSRPAVSEGGIMTDATEGVIDPEQLIRLVRVPRGNEFGRRVHPAHAAFPVVESGHRQRRRDRRLPAGRLAEQKNESVVGDSVRRFSVRVGWDESR